MLKTYVEISSLMATKQFENIKFTFGIEVNINDDEKIPFETRVKDAFKIGAKLCKEQLNYEQNGVRERLRGNYDPDSKYY